MRLRAKGAQNFKPRPLISGKLVHETWLCSGTTPCPAEPLLRNYSVGQETSRRCYLKELDQREGSWIIAVDPDKDCR